MFWVMVITLQVLGKYMIVRYLDLQGEFLKRSCNESLAGSHEFLSNLPSRCRPRTSYRAPSPALLKDGDYDRV